MKDGGDKEIRTPDPLNANQVLYQLSYIPVVFLVMMKVRLNCVLLASELR